VKVGTPRSVPFCSSEIASSRVGNHCNCRGNRIYLEKCRRNACSVLCIGVGTRLANRYLIMSDFTVGTVFTQPLAGTCSNVSIQLQFWCTKYIYSNKNPNLMPLSTLILGTKFPQLFSFFLEFDFLENSWGVCYPPLITSHTNYS
jgi:hypothetical protein